MLKAVAGVSRDFVLPADVADLRRCRFKNLRSSAGLSFAYSASLRGNLSVLIWAIRLHLIPAFAILRRGRSAGQVALK